MITASKGERLLAFLIDLLLVFGPIFAIQTLCKALGGTSPLWDTASLVATVSMMLANTFLSIQSGQSLGKKLMQIRVVDLEDQPLTTRALFARSAWTALIFAMSAIGLSTLDAAMAGLKGDGRSLHDMLAGSKVVSDRTSAAFQAEGKGIVLRSDGTIAQLPHGWEAIDTPPTLFAIRLMGTRMFDGDPVEPSGRILSGTLCFVLFILPVFGIRRYLYSRENGSLRFYARAPVTSAFAMWNLGVMVAALGLATFTGLQALMPDLFRPAPLPQATPTAQPAAHPPGKSFVLQQAEEALTHKDWASALSYANLSLQDPATQRRALEITGIAQTHLKNYGKALEAYRKLTHLDPKNPAYKKALKECQSKAPKSH